MTAQASSVTSSVLSALANDGRRRILRVIADRGGEMTSGEVAEQFSTAWSTTTRHLAVLHEAGLVSVERRGRERVYRAEAATAQRALAVAALDLHPRGEHTMSTDVTDLTL